MTSSTMLTMRMILKRQSSSTFKHLTAPEEGLTTAKWRCELCEKESLVECEVYEKNAKRSSAPHLPRR